MEVKGDYQIQAKVRRTALRNLCVKQIVSNTRNWVPEVSRTAESLDELNKEVKGIS